MRLACTAVLLAACSADVAPGSYFCGPEQLCPEGQACNGVDHICVLPSKVQPFSCQNENDPMGDDSPSSGQVIANLACVSEVKETRGCLIGNDPGDWYQLDVPATCTAVQIQARVQFPVAFQPLGFQFSTSNGPASAVDSPCKATTQDDGEDIRCFAMTVTPGSHVAVGVVRTGDADCGGTCAHNRFLLDVQLSTP